MDTLPTIPSPTATKYHLIDAKPDVDAPAEGTTFLVMVGYPRNPLADHYLQGPRPPQHVKRLGYGFTKDLAEAWPFPSLKSAQAKARIVAKHMTWSEHEMVIEEHPPVPAVD